MAKLSLATSTNTLNTEENERCIRSVKCPRLKTFLYVKTLLIGRHFAMLNVAL